MPLTFFAHQGPFLAITRRWPDRVDPLTFMIGTMAPDLAYVLESTRLEVWAHGWPWILAFNVPVTLFVAWIVSRVIAPVLFDHLPNAGGFRLRDYRRLAAHRFRPVVSTLSAFVGALSHVVLDQFTHSWGWAAQRVDWYRRPLVDERWLGKLWTPYEFGQFGGHVGLSLLCLVLLWRHGRDRQRLGEETLLAPGPVTLESRLLLWPLAAVGLAVGAVWVLLHPISEGSDVIRLVACTGVGTAAGSLAVLIARRGLRTVTR